MSREASAITRRTLLKWAGLGSAAAFLAGCGGTPAAAPTVAPTGAAPKTTPAAKTVSISFTTQGTPEELAMFERMIAAFEQKTPTVKVERKFDPSLTWQKVHTMLGAGTASSVQRSNDDDIFLLLSQGTITGLDDYIARDLKREDYYPYVFTKRIGPGGEVGAATIGTSPWILFYNTKHFEEAGLTPATDWAKAWDFKTMDAALDKLVKKDASGKITRYAFYYMDATPQFHIGNWGGPWPYNECETECTLYDENAIRCLTWLQDINCKRKIGVPTGENPVQLFNSGLLSIMMNGVGQAAQIKSDVPWDAMPMHFGDAPAGKAKNLTGADERCFVIPVGEKEKEAAWQMLRWMMTEPGQIEFAKVDYLTPGLKKVAQGPDFNDPKRPPKNRKPFFEGTENIILVPPDNPVGDLYTTSFSRTTNELRDCTKTPQVFLRERVDRLNQALKDSKWNKCTNWKKGWRLEGVKGLVPLPAEMTATASAPTPTPAVKK